MFINADQDIKLIRKLFMSTMNELCMAVHERIILFDAFLSCLLTVKGSAIFI